MKNSQPAVPVQLVGSAYERGFLQSKFVGHDAVTSAIEFRLDLNRGVYSNLSVRKYLEQQWDFAQQHCVEELAEMVGVADGFGIDTRRLFDFLHMGIVKNLNTSVLGGDGCSTWAVSLPGIGPAVGKNRDFMGEHAGLQTVFLHQNSAWPNGQRMLCVGSFGAPGAYSSGVNSDGLTIVDTQVATSDYGVGWLRYFLMTRILNGFHDVNSALDYIKSVPHAGGGSLILSDTTGKMAAVDLGHKSISISERLGGWVARTNHFEAGSVPNRDNGIPIDADSIERKKSLIAGLEEKDRSIARVIALMASHTKNGEEGLCCHGGLGDTRTLSGAIYLCKSRKLYFTNGNPCVGNWLEYSV